MRRIRPRPPSRRSQGLTLIELIVAMVILAIVVGLTIYFLTPVRQAFDLTTRAELTDAADNALQRIGRELRSALPNSVRVTIGTPASLVLVEFLPVRTAGRYRAEGDAPVGGTACTSGTPSDDQLDQLAFGIVDKCFKSIGKLSNQGSITNRDFLVLNNYGAGFAGQDAYAMGTNVRQVTSSAEEASARQRIEIASGTFTASLHESPGKRFFIVSGRLGGVAQPEPVTFECDTAAGTLTRRWGYAISTTQPATPAEFATGVPVSALLASNVASCGFDYNPNVAPQVGVMTLRLTLSKARTDGGNEIVSLYQAIHVSNVP